MQAAAQLDAAKEALAREKAAREQAADTEKHCAELHAEREQVERRARQAQDALELREPRERERLSALERRIASRASERREARQKLAKQRQSALETLRTAPIVQRACSRLALAERIEALRGERWESARQADGPLDAERKRMFLRMKREVLRLGGYAREYFISQTPELAAMVDAVIDLDALQVTASASRTFDAPA